MAIKKPIFSITADYDVCLTPYSPVSETDELEIRAQVFNSGADGEVTVHFYLDSTLLNSRTLPVNSQSYGFARTFVSMKEHCGTHTVTVEIDTKCGDILQRQAVLPLVVKKSMRPVLDGGFVMLGPPNDRVACDSFREDVKSMTDDDWKRYIAELAKIGQTCVIIMVSHQWNLLEAPKEERYIHAHYDSALYPKSDIAAKDPIAAILEESEKHGIHVFLGIGNQYGYAGKKEDIEELYGRYGKYKSFYGWYLARELNMRYYRKEDWDVLCALTGCARALAPVKPVLNSPMCIPTDECLVYLMEHDVLDIMMPQDWVGQKHQTLAESDEMHRRLLPVCKKTRKHLWANCEAFNFVTEAALDEAVPVLVPRFLDGGMDGEAGFLQQMQVARPYVEKIMNFMFSGFFTPPGFEPKIGGDAAVKQYVDYLKSIEK